MKHKSWSEPFLKDHPEIVKVIVHQEDVDFDFSYLSDLFRNRNRTR